MNDNRKQAYVEWVTGLDTEPPLEGAFNAGWLAREAEVEWLKQQAHDENVHRRMAAEAAEEFRAEVERLRTGKQHWQDVAARLNTENARLVMQHENLSRECLGQYELMSAEAERLRALVQEHIMVHHCLVCGSEPVRPKE
jgi:hypothetical protein